MNKSQIKEQASSKVPTEWGTFVIAAYSDRADDLMPHMAIYHPEIDTDSEVTMRIHSECVTGDIFHSMKCDCGQQLAEAMKVINEEKGIILYLRQEGRGIGIINKLKAYRYQEDGLDTIEANEALGLQAEYRDYGIAASMLRSLGISTVKLLTNNPLKIEGLESHGITVTERVPLIITPNAMNKGYLDTKKESMGHLL